MTDVVRLLDQLREIADALDSSVLGSPDWETHLDLVEATAKDLNSLLQCLRKKRFLRDFGEREDDIYVATFPKSGTTMMQMILYQLTTDGEMDFAHIYDVSPWIKWSAVENTPPRDVPSPRIIKTHDTYSEMTEIGKGRFIYVVRSAPDVMNSLYHHYKAYNNPKTSFVHTWQSKAKCWFSHVSAWVENRKRLPVLLMRYEDLLSNKEREIRKIVDFCGLGVTEETIRRAIERSSFDFMKKHQKKFGEQPEPFKVFDQFIRRGQPGEGLSAWSRPQKEEYQRLFAEKFSTSAFMKSYRFDDSDAAS